MIELLSKEMVRLDPTGQSASSATDEFSVSGPETNENFEDQKHADSDEWPESSTIQDIEQSTVVVALESWQCYVCFKTIEETKLLRNPSLLAYELEEHLPFDGDDLAVAKVISKVGWLIIAANGCDLKSHVSDLQENGTEIAAIVPTIFLALNQLSQDQSFTDIDAIAWKSSGGTDVIRFVQGAIVDWRWIDHQEYSLANCLQSLEIEKHEKVLLINHVPDFDDGLKSIGTIHHLELDREETASVECIAITKGTSRPLIDLRNGPLEPHDRWSSIRPPLRFFISSIFILQIALIGFAMLRTMNYRTKSNLEITEQENQFRNLFPGEPIPAGVASRMRSEHRILIANAGSESNTVPYLGSVVPVIHSLLSNLPPQEKVRFELNHIEVLPHEIRSLTGSTRSIKELDEITANLRAGGFEVPRVSPSKIADGVTLRIDSMRLLAKEGEAK